MEVVNKYDEKMSWQIFLVAQFIACEFIFYDFDELLM